MNKIEVKIETEERMMAITNLCIGIKEAAKSLNRPPEVYINNNTFNGGDPAVRIETVPEVKETIIYKE